MTRPRRPRLRWALAVLPLLWFGAARAQAPADGVFYEIFVRSFQDSDGDGIGDLRGVLERLDYLQALGVDGIWLMPIHPSPSYHGYDVTDFTAVHPDYGTLDDFRALADATEARGMHLLLDLVVNHTSDRHPWFRAAVAGDSERRDWYVWSDDPPPWRAIGGGPAWHEPAGAPDGARYLGLFWSGMPELNHRNPEVTAELERVARFWLEQGADGFRVDAIQHVVEGEDGVIANAPENLSWVAAFNESVREAGGWLLGETWMPTPMIARYHREANLDASFNYPLYHATLDAIRTRNATALEAVLAQDARAYPDDAVRAPFVSNHDQSRPATALSPLRRDVERLKLAAGLLLTAPGVPFVYYGEEIGLPDGAGGDDPAKRTPMRWRDGPGAGFTGGTPWQPFATDDPAVTVDAQAGDPDSLLEHYRRLIALRRAQPTLATGTVRVLDPEAGAVLAVLREPAPDAADATDARDATDAADTASPPAGDRLLLLANLGTRPLELDLADLLPADAGGVAGGAHGVLDLLSGEALRERVALDRLQLRVLQLP